MFGGCGEVLGSGKVIPRTLTSLADITNEVNESMLVTITGPLTAVGGFDTTTVSSNDFIEFRVHAGGDRTHVRAHVVPDQPVAARDGSRALVLRPVVGDRRGRDG